MIIFFDDHIKVRLKFRATYAPPAQESLKQRLFLRRCGCELIQGFYYSRPLPPEALAQFVTARAAQVALLGTPAEAEVTEAKSLCVSAK